MNKCIFQFWEESERGWGIRPDGCSIHSTKEELNIFIENIYKNRGDDVPKEYDRIIGDPMECFISDKLYDKLKQSGSLRLFESEKNNLISMEEIIFKPNEVF
jgi:hypothetical protein